MDIQTYKDVFSCFSTFSTGLRVNDVLQPQRLMILLRLMPDQVYHILDTMVAEGYLVKNSGNSKSPLGSVANAWHLTEEGCRLYRELCG